MQSNYFKCPNPACQQMFDFGMVLAMPGVQCPSCGTTFKLVAGPAGYQIQLLGYPPTQQYQPPAPPTYQQTSPTQQTNPFAPPPAPPPQPAPTVQANPFAPPPALAPWEEAASAPMPQANPFAPPRPAPAPWEAAPPVAAPQPQANPFAPPPPASFPAPSSAPTHGYASPAGFPGADPMAGQMPAQAVGQTQSPDAGLVTRVPKRRQKTGIEKVGGFVTFGLFIGLAIFAGLAIYFVLQQAGGTSVGKLFVDEEYNYKWNLPGSGWKQDDKLRSLMGANLLAFRRKDGSAFITLACTDPKSPRVPSDLKVFNGTIARLKGYFRMKEGGSTLQFNTETELSEQDKGRSPFLLSGKKALFIKFEGIVEDEDDSRSITYTGEAYAIVHQGMAYWYYQWAPSDKYSAVLEELDSIRSRFQVMDGRAKWKPDEKSIRKFTSDDGTLVVRDVDRIWNKLRAVNLLAPDPNDPNSKMPDTSARRRILTLTSPFPLGDQKRALGGSLYFYSIAEDPGLTHLEQLRKIAEAQYAVDLGEEIKVDFTPLPPKEGLRVPDTVKEWTSYSVSFLGKSEFVFTAVLKQPGRVVGAEGRCATEVRNYWEERFMDLLENVQK